MGFLFDERYVRDFELLGWLHLLILALAVGSLVGMHRARHHLRRPEIGRTFRVTVAILIVVGEVVFQVWMASLHGFRWAEFVPLGLCAMVEWITVVTLLLDLKRVAKVVLPWASVGSLLSFVVVNMGTSYGFPHFRFLHYFGIHWLFLVGNLYYLFTGQFRYTYRDLVRSTLWLAGVSAVVLAIDLATGQNFMFLVEWPAELDFVNQLLPFPLNTLGLVLGAFILFNLFYLIFVFGRFDAAPEQSAGQRGKAPVGVVGVDAVAGVGDA
jgi:hypothetical integral membrane protein (TIGR02206 family)